MPKKIHEADYVCEVCGETWTVSDEDGFTKKEFLEYFTECPLCGGGIGWMFNEIWETDGFWTAVKRTINRIKKKGLK